MHLFVHDPVQYLGVATFFQNGRRQYESSVELLWQPYGIGQAIIFLSCGFYVSLYPSFSRLFSAVVD